MCTWILVVQSTFNRVELGAQDWRDAILLQYEIKPTDLPQHCDGCSVRSSISHALDYKKGDLIMSSHNKICEKNVYLTSKSLTPTHIRDNPPMNPGCSVRSVRSPLSGPCRLNNPPVAA